jgi:aspartate kinase
MRNSACIVANTIQQGNVAVVVVSAMQGVTNSLLDQVKGLIDSPVDRECDSLISSGEQISASLFSMTLRQLGINAKSILGWQIPIKTNNFFSSADIKEISVKKIIDHINSGVTPVIAGFQGVTEDLEITTLGRGGSDTTAVAISYSINADECLIYTDVDGIYTADPRIALNSRRIDEISYTEMLELSASGAKVLQARSVLLAMNCNVKLRVLSSFNTAGETKVTDLVKIPKNSNITGISSDVSNFKITISDENLDELTILSFISNKIPIDMFSATNSGQTKVVSFFAGKIHEKELRELLAEYKNISIDDDVGILTLVGSGMKTDLSILSNIFAVLKEKQINANYIGVSELSIKIVVPIMQIDIATNSLHSFFFERMS